MTTPYDSFTTDTAWNIVSAFDDMVDYGTLGNIDDAFKALKKSPHQNDVINTLEKQTVSRLRVFAKEWGGVKDVEEDREAMLKTHGSGLKTTASVLFRIADLKKENAHPLTLAFMQQFNKLAPDHRFKAAYLAEAFNAAATAEQGADEARWNVPGLVDVFYNFFSPHAEQREKLLNQVAALDAPTRDTLMASCEKTFLRQIITAPGDIDAPGLQANLDFSRYLSHERGTAADPLLTSYVSAVSAITLKAGDLYHAPDILAVARAHIAALSSQDQLKQIADARKKRLCVPSA